MSRILRSGTKYKRLKAAFPPDNEVTALVARLSVLFEDLRIEYLAAHSAKMPVLDVLQPMYRKLYFLRRSTITILEFAGSFEHLNNQPAFHSTRARFDRRATARWTAAADFFVTNKKFLKEIRNDYGGHFQLQAARTILSEMNSDTAGSLEFVFDHIENTAEPRLHYAYDIVSGALGLHTGPGEAYADYLRRLFVTIKSGWGHCADVVHTLTAYIIEPAFS